MRIFKEASRVIPGFLFPASVAGSKEGDMDSPSAIMVRVPEVFGRKEARKLQRELRNKIGNDVPCVIVDLSRVKKIDLAGVEGLLSCMEQIARSDGSVQLGGISPEAATILELTRMNSLINRFPAFPAEAPSFALTPETVAEEAPSKTTSQPQTVAA
jgi:anti-anti-sigma regulatory factor